MWGCTGNIKIRKHCLPKAKPERNYVYALPGKSRKILLGIASKWGLLLRERICSHREQILTFKSSSLWQTRKLHNILGDLSVLQIVFRTHMRCTRNGRYAYAERKTGEEKIMTKQTPHMTPPTHKTKELQQRNRPGSVSRKSTAGLKPVLFSQNLILNSFAAPNYKYMFSRNIWRQEEETTNFDE